MTRMRSTVPELVVGVIGFCAVVALFSLSSEGEARKSDAQDHWERRIREVGGRAAYGEFAASVESLDALERHEMAHGFGAALFSVEGIGGFSVCDERFSYGCFHEFLGRAIADRGTRALRALNERCFEVDVPAPLTCQHGIGHGIQAYFGYGRPTLNNSLEECEKLSRTDPIGGCYGGVFMEYNLRTMLGDEGSVRPMTSSWLEPCDTLPAPFDRPCAFWLPEWWRVALAPGMNGSRELYAKMGSLCRTLSSTSTTQLCFEGVGVVAPIDARFDSPEIIALCEAAAAVARENAWCASYAADILERGGAGQRGNGEAVCLGLTDVYRAYCMAFARGEVGSGNPPPHIP
jgi:hypothetical protein